ncbi:hypothetical protein [Bradyrhizobium sp. Ai1a-2]|uniref:hypothetical protein n=1 Tax=Bradyrhizobium sp. Ai1a-2 TaxID=196490 RepID=UPI00041C930A|nr:hypothetical protein [Bradyrhizobium sp. Ai1a-2]
MPAVEVEFPFTPGDAVRVKTRWVEPFEGKVFSVVRRYGAQDFAVVVDAKGGTHHAYFTELSAS